MLVTLLDKDFKDGEWHSLRSSLSYAFINCSKQEFDSTIKIITTHTPNANNDERNFRYCNQIIADIQNEQSLQQDNPLELQEVKQIINNLIIL